METKELRIENLVSCNGTIKKVVSIKDMIINNHQSFRYDPIPLTEEWLLKMGFNYDDERKEFLGLSILSISIYSDCSNNFKTAEMQLRQSRIKIKYVHQLQNLYFALTGQELTINQ